MRKLGYLLGFLVLVAIEGCIAQPARANWPWEAEKAPAKSAWPWKDCDCSPCTCDPKECVCPNCATGCGKGKAGAASLTDAVYSVGVVDAPATAWPFSTQVASSVPTQTFHTEMRQVCNGTSCQMVAVTVPDMASVGGTSAVTYAASAPCSTCGTSTAYTGSDGTASAPRTFRTPIRTILGRIFGGRKGGRGCGG